MRFTRYTLVGLAATAMHYALLVALMVLPDMPAALAAGVGALFGALFSYAGNRSLTFDCDLPHAVALPRFLTVAALGVAALGRAGAPRGSGRTVTRGVESRPKRDVVLP